MKHSEIQNVKISYCFYRLPFFEHFGVYYKDVMYYLSTNPDINVVKHTLDEGNRIKVIEQCKIPNRHLNMKQTRNLQG